MVLILFHLLFFSTAEEIVRKWLKGVEGDSGSNHEKKGSFRCDYTTSPPPSPTARDEVDYLGSLDWSHGNVADNAKSVVEGLLRRDLQGVNSPTTHTKQCNDPRITMEMRHKKVCFGLSPWQQCKIASWHNGNTT